MVQCTAQIVAETHGRAVVRAWPVLILVACAGEASAPVELRLDGPAEVHVEHYGAVEGPKAVLSDGTEPVGLSWSVTPDTVAVATGGGVEAVGPGRAVVTGQWRDQEIRWTLLVEPAIALHFVEPPGTVAVGEKVDLRVQGRLGEHVVETGALTWASSDDAVLTVADGAAVARSAGVVYVTAESVGGSRATVQLEVTELVTRE